MYKITSDFVDLYVKLINQLIQINYWLNVYYYKLIINFIYQWNCDFIRINFDCVLICQLFQ